MLKNLCSFVKIEKSIQGCVKMIRCRVCGSSVAKHSCLVIKEDICTNCCSSFQLCKLKKWEQLLEANYNIDLLSDNCLKCKSLTRNTGEELEIEGPFSQFSFEYMGKYIFDNKPDILFNKKKKVLLEQLPELDYEGKYHLADCLYQLGKREQAIEVLEQIVDQDEFIEIPLLLGKIYKSNDNYDEAEKNFKKVLLIDSSNAEAYRELADVLQLKENHHGSIHYYLESLENFGATKEGEINDYFHQMNYIGLAISYSKLNQLEQVIQSATNYLDQEPKWDDFISSVNEHRDGTAHYINMDFDIYAHSTLYHLMAISYIEINQLDMAEKYINRALMLNSNNTSFATVKGIIIGRKHGQGEITRYKEEMQTLKVYAELRASSITTLKSFTPAEQVILYTGNNHENLQSFLVKQILSSLRNVLSISSHITPSEKLAADEDKYTDLFRTTMKWLSEVFGWTTHTQDRGGFTRELIGIRGGIGERDIIIKSQEDKDLMLGEALILKGVNKESVKLHTEKPFGYDIQSSNFHMIINWGFAPDPDKVWGNYKEVVSSRTEGYFSVLKTGELEELIPDVDKQALRTFYTRHSTDQDGIEATVIHVYVDIYNHMKRVIADSARNKK